MASNEVPVKYGPGAATWGENCGKSSWVAWAPGSWLQGVPPQEREVWEVLPAKPVVYKLFFVLNTVDFRHWG